ncbi:MAG: menaquinone biosynthesis protein [Nitrospirae bacterium]|nr:menaquinone biosynthesis protein [Nitrospirota bacterium]
MEALKLKIGKIAYTNLFPIFYTLEKDYGCPEHEIISGVPSDLNRKIRLGEIDISPSSSIEYLRNRELYNLIDNHSISSFGPVWSILLFSKQPIETLDGKTVLTSSHSETSVALLQIIFRKFYEIDCRLISTPETLEKGMRSNAAQLLIGDEALSEALKWPGLHIYDLGDIWYRFTGLPSVFALWIIRKDCCGNRQELVEKFISDLDRAKASALKNLKAIAAACPGRDLLSEEELVSYWQGISYAFGEEHRKGLDLFRRYAEELGLI